MATDRSSQLPPERSGDMRMLMEQAPVGIIVVDMAGRIIDVNRAACQILGAPDEEAFLSLNVLDMPRLVENGVSELFRRAIEQEATIELETPYFTQWGKEVYLRAKLSPRYDEQGRQIGVIQIVEDVSQEKLAESRLKQQLEHERALALATRTLLQSPEDKAHQVEILNEALAYLREATQVGRAYIFRNFYDEELGECMDIVAEACAPGVPPSLHIPENHRFPWALMPEEMHRALSNGEPFGGDVEVCFADHEIVLEDLRKSRILSVQLFPIFFAERWWGFVGFDAVETVRQWTPQENQLLLIMADIFGSALQRWEVERTLQEERDALERRVQERTALLERRLQLERVLDTIAARLMAREDFGKAMQQTLSEIGEALGAIEVLLVQIDIKSRRILNTYRWHPPGIEEWPFVSGPGADWFRQQIITRKPLYITDTAAFFAEEDLVRKDLLAWNVRALMTYPLVVDDEIVGIFNVCLGEPLADDVAPHVIEMLDIMAHLLNGLLQRQLLIERRDRQILDQTRALSAMLDAAMLDTGARELSDVVMPLLSLIADLSQAQTLAVYGLQEDGRFERIADLGVGDVGWHWAPAFQPSQRISTWFSESTAPMLLNPDQLESMMPFTPGDDDQSGVGMIVNIRAWRHFEGLLFCYRPGGEQYSPNQVAMTMALADYMSTIIENYLLREIAETSAIIEERQRLARDLHDSVSQSLYGVMLFARAARDAAEGGDLAALEVDMARVEENALRALKEMRLLLFQLQPLSLERGGLARALTHRFEQVESRLGIETELDIDPTITLPKDVEETLYRLASEALNNALKHAEATRVGVRLAREGAEIVLSIFDNGRGFDSERVASSGMGLTNMRFRAEKAGGVLAIESAPGQGATIQCRILAERLLDDQAR